MKKPEVEIYDTTLRDGTQGEGINFSVADKLRLAERMEAMGFHYIEGGWPGSNPRDIEFFAQARQRKFRKARLAAFGSTRRKNTDVAKDPQVRLLLEAETPVVTGFGNDAFRERGDDCGHRALPEGERPFCGLRCRARF
jgi:2-isopropylmalate synthase